jgi:molecular chaperone GrpE
VTDQPLEPRLEDEELVEEPEAEEESAAPAPDDSYLRLAADFDNYRKRTAREHAELTQRANERLLNELLPVLDDLERALQAAEERSSRYGVSGADASADDRLRQAYADEAKLEDGVRLVHRSLAELLRREGLEEIDTEGRFDPHVHEALLSQPAEAESGSVLEVLQKGYKLGDRVLRPSRVIVAE